MLGLFLGATLLLSVSAQAQSEALSDPSVSEAGSAAIAKPRVSISLKNAALIRKEHTQSYYLVLEASVTADLTNNTDQILSVMLYTPSASRAALVLENGTKLALKDVSGIQACNKQEAPACARENKSGYVAIEPGLTIRVSLALRTENYAVDKSQLPHVMASRTASFVAMLDTIDASGTSQLIPLNLNDMPINNNVTE
ncbi:MAG TPA: hypothetical protein PKX87_05170 [Alphaproteobacteria bacterium]|nr:hypothetical protein [Alphaproteobacteria bacterium]